MNKCILCNNSTLTRYPAHFVPFIAERMFKGNPPSTTLLYCPHCDFYYSSYRPTEEEMSRLYAGYRGKEYQKQRQQHEPYYTPACNANLSSPAEIERRTSHVFTILSTHVDISSIKTVLDFGGDEGQFIPKELIADKYVYDISHDASEARGGGEIHCTRSSCYSDMGFDYVLSRA